MASASRKTPNKYRNGQRDAAAASEGDQEGPLRQMIGSAEEQKQAFEEDLAAILAATENDLLAESSDTDVDEELNVNDNDNQERIHVIPQERSEVSDSDSEEDETQMWMASRHNHTRVGQSFQVDTLPQLQPHVHVTSAAHGLCALKRTEK
jgi:hypothetical protein